MIPPFLSQVSISLICPGFIQTEITQGGGLGRDGKPLGSSAGMKGGAGPVKMITAADCAAQVLAAAEARAPQTIVPKYPYSLLYHLRKFFPRAVDAWLVRTFAPPPRKKKSKGD